MSVHVRPYEPRDYDAVCAVARDTAWFGEPMEKGYGQSHELVALLRVIPYLEHSPHLAFVAEEHGQVLGYALAVADSHTHHRWLARHLPGRLLQLAPALAWADAQLLLRHAMNGGGGELDENFLKDFPAHLHINLSAAARGKGVGRQLMQRVLGALKNEGVTGVHLGTSNRNQGADAFFRAMGFRLISQRPYRLWPGLGGGDNHLLIYGQSLSHQTTVRTGQRPPLAWGDRLACGVHHHDFAQLMPGPGIPPDAPAQPSLNNCDVTLYKGTYYLAYRTARTHFASGGSTLAMLSSQDFKTWRFVGALSEEGFDFREPRFLVLGDRLLFYYFASRDNPTDFDPAGSFVMDLSEGRFPAEKHSLLAPGWVPWRPRAHGVRVVFSAYWGEGFHRELGQKTCVRLFESKDGFNFSPLTETPQLGTPGASETDFIFLPDGSAIGAIRNDLTGGHVFRTAPGDLTRWTVTDVPWRLDSPLVFTLGGRVFLACRRHPGTPIASGAESRLPGGLGVMARWLRYSFTPKRTALYEIHTDNLKLEHLFDLPSKGDTAFAAVSPKNSKSLWLVNYTSPVDGPDVSWMAGQLGHTVLTQAVLSLG